MYFQVYREAQGGRNAEWRWRLRAGNNEIIAVGESYSSRASCLHAVNLVKEVTARTRVDEIEDDR